MLKKKNDDDDYARIISYSCGEPWTHQSWGTPWPVIWPAAVQRERQGEACGSTWWSSAAGWTRPPSKGIGRLRTQPPVRCAAPERWWKPSKPPGNTEDLFSVTARWHNQQNLKYPRPFYQERRNVFGDEVVEVGLVADTERLLVLPLLWRKGPLHFHRLLQERGHLGTQQVWMRELCSVIYYMSETGSETQWGTSLSSNSALSPPHMLVTLLCCSLIQGCTIIPLCVIVLYLFACEMWMPKLTVMVMALRITNTNMNGPNKLQNFESWGSQVTRCCPRACLAWLIRNIHSLLIHSRNINVVSV